MLSVLAFYCQLEDKEIIFDRSIPDALIQSSHVGCFRLYLQTDCSLTHCLITVPCCDIIMLKTNTQIKSFSLFFVLGTYG